MAIKHIEIQANNPVEVTSKDIDSLALCLTDVLDKASTMQGELHSEYAYRDAVKALTDRFKDLKIRYDKEFMQFKDPEVLKILLANIVHESTEGILADEFLKITTISTWFRNNTEIKLFPELAYTNILSFSRYAFDGCTALEEVDLPNTAKVLPTQMF